MKKAKEMALTLAESDMSVSDIADVVKASEKIAQEWLSGDMNLALVGQSQSHN